MMSIDDEARRAMQGPPTTQSEFLARSMQQSTSGGSNPRQTSMASSGPPSAQYRVSQTPEGIDLESSRIAPEIQSKEGADESTARMRYWVIIFGLLIVICVGAAAIVVPLYVKPQYESDPIVIIQTGAPAPSASVVPNSSPTQAPTPKDVPTLPPTTAAFATFVNQFALEISGSEAFENPDSPQYKAADFIANDAEYAPRLSDKAMLGDLYAASVFYFSTAGEYWFECSQGSDNCPDGISWMSSNVTYCHWSWIGCNDAGRIVDIVFSENKGNNLTGTLTSELGLLTELEQFVAVNDDIKGALPDELGSLTHMTHLILANNSLSGRISDTFLENSPVEVFMLSDNKFKGNIPKSLTLMPSILQIFLRNNRFSGPIPEELGALPHLATLDLAGNRFEGEIPDSIFSPTMENLYLGGNSEITGTLSPAVGSAANLVRLYISGTRISGSLPDDLFTLGHLSELVLSNNTLTGELPESVANLGGTLRLMKLDGNKFSGDMPSAAINSLVVSNVLTFDRNSFTGAISPTTCRRRGDGYHDLQILSVDCAEVTCSCCNNCAL